MVFTVKFLLIYFFPRTRSSLLLTVAYVCVYWPRLVIMCVCVCVCVFCFGLSLVGYCVSCVLLGLFYVFTSLVSRLGLGLGWLY